MPSPSETWTDLGDGVLVRQSRAYRMNSIVIARDGRALVVDAGVLPSELDDIAARVGGLAPRFSQVTLAFTHPHWDHVLARPWFPAATTLAHVGFADELARDAEKIAADAGAWIEGAGERLPAPFRPFTPDVTVRGTVRVECGPCALVAHETPGHCASQVALHVPELGLLVSGDTLSDIEIPWLEGPPWVYRRTLVALHWLYEQEDIRTLVPGHGSIARGRLEGYRRVRRDLEYLMALEQRVGGAFARGMSLAEAQAELARMEYLGKDADYPMNDVHRDNVKFAWDGLADRADADDGPRSAP
jgi:glyoxylase-like metal-dependent hydrolase (beta-lactamase superfamily II)